MILLVKVHVCNSPCYDYGFTVISFNKGLKRQTHDMLAVQAGDLVLEVNRVVVSPGTVDMVSTVHDAQDLNNQIYLQCRCQPDYHPNWMVASLLPSHPWPRLSSSLSLPRCSTNWWSKPGCHFNSSSS